LRGILATFAAVAAAIVVSTLLWEGLDRAGVTSADPWFVHVRGISMGAITAIVVAVVLVRHRRTRMATLERSLSRRSGALVEAEALLQSVMDNVPVALIVIDRNMRIVQTNPKAVEVHGMSLVGQRCFDRRESASEHCRECPAWGTFKTGSPQQARGYTVDPRTNEVLAVESHPLQMPGGAQYVLLVERVVTEEKKLQMSLIHQEKMASLGLLSASIAHDMGNPLSSLDLQLQLMSTLQGADDSKEIIETMQQETARLRRTLREIVDFGRRRRDEATHVSVTAVVDDALKLIRYDQRTQKVVTGVDADPETPPVFIVEDHLMQVILNLMLNALDAMPQGGELRVVIRPAGQQVVVRIHDTGTGMERAVLDHCFEPQFTTKSPDRGTGLGLSICKDIARAAGGDIEVHSAPGQGTTVLVFLPAATDVAGEEP
jgi:PAS domain S-box-containing protein